ncbi:hypothetical protein XALC_1366 [Xanthomonas albilineans GPE PC73]|uniref:Uncharacterized protein n=1 Tax=Xanthomonas albilineans (strain GPE PC73 / CFBP 7063) TaxID=380358 RepID=D2UD92_XANAP|nr:hypothetical protein XALC_1366 [Xanthomonas albilineans GPE PC73]
MSGRVRCACMAHRRHTPGITASDCKVFLRRCGLADVVKKEGSSCGELVFDRCLHWFAPHSSLKSMRENRMTLHSGIAVIFLIAAISFFNHVIFV